MKYLADPSLNALSRTLSHTSAECTVHSRIEAYSCKPINKDKKLWRAIDEHYEDEMAVNAQSPPYPSNASPLNSAFGPLDQPSARRTLCLLIATLNVAHPDHDFSDVSPDHFTREENGGASVLSALSTTLLSLRDAPSSTHGSQLSSRSYSSFPTHIGEFFPSSNSASSSPVNSTISATINAANTAPPIVTNTHPTLFRILNDVVTLSECEVYSYVPDIYSDPHAVGDSDSEEDSDSTSSDSSSDIWDGNDDEISPTSSHRRSVAPWDSSPFLLYDDVESPSLPSQNKPLPISDKSDPLAIIPSSFDSNTFGVMRRRRRRRGGLLWSSHTFFFHKKEKKILYISVWARHNSISTWDRTIQPREDVWVAGEDSFAGWDGAVGAGARAFEVAERRKHAFA